MPVLIAACVARTCLGDTEATWDALLRGESGVGDLRYHPADRLNVRHGYHIGPPRPEPRLAASDWLTECVAEALERSGVDPRHERVAAFVGTGLRELRAVERGVLGDRAELHFAGAVRRAGVPGALTLSGACSAGGYALALGQDLLAAGEADAVVVAGTDGMTGSMLAMIGRVDEHPTDRVRPFDTARTGVLLGEGAAALVLVPEDRAVHPVARLLGTGLSCDAGHETAPDAEGITRAVYDAFTRTGVPPDTVDLVVAHGTGTGRNDPTEAGVLRDVFAGCTPGPWVTAVKGAVGHTSGASALSSLAVAVACLRCGVVPPVVGLRQPLPEGEGLRFVVDRPQWSPVRRAMVNAFGFGGVNAVTLLEAR